MDQWFVVGVNHDLASLSVVAKVRSGEEFATESAVSPFSREDRQHHLVAMKHRLRQWRHPPSRKVGRQERDAPG